jgi:hypothetical protein
MKLNKNKKVGFLRKPSFFIIRIVCFRKNPTFLKQGVLAQSQEIK